MLETVQLITKVQAAVLIMDKLPTRWFMSISTYADISDSWANISKDVDAQDWTRFYYLLHRQPKLAWPVDSDTLHPVTPRVRELNKFNLKELGCWDG